MNINHERLPDDPEELKNIIAELSAQDERKQAHIEWLEKESEVLHDELALLRQKLFGRSSERYSEAELTQQSLFNEELGATEGPETTVEVSPHVRRKPVRKSLPPDLPRIEVIHDIDEEEKICGCGAELVRIGEESSEKLDIIPQKLQVIRHIRPKYACKACEGSGDEEHPAVRIAPPPQEMIPKGIASAGLLAYIVTSKYVDAIPYYRQAKQFDRIGIDLPRSTMCEWVMETGRKCEPLVELMSDEIRSGPMIQMDETTVQVLGEEGRENTAKSYMWVVRGGDPNHPLVLYHYHRGRSSQIPLRYLQDYTGYLQTDGYKGYDDAGELPGITHVGCWAHVRRKFFDAQKASKKTGSAEEAIARIGKLYQIESELRTSLEAGELSEDEFVSKRKERVEPILEQFYEYLQKKSGQVPPSTLLGKAVSYSLGQWPKLMRYLDASFLTPDTNRVENAIRPFVLGRKNWLFSGSPRGAYSSSALYSLVETAKANGLEPYRYLRFLFEKIPLAREKEDLEKLLPHRFDPAKFNSS